MRYKRLIACFLLLALFCGCSRRQTTPAGETKLSFYYKRADAGEDSFSDPTGALEEKQVTLGGDVSAQEVLNAYLEAPDGEGLLSLFPEGTACLGAKLQNGVLVLDMNEAYASLTGFARTLAAAGLTMTLTQLEDVQTVEIRTSFGAQLGKASTRWTQDSFLMQDMSWLYPERTVQLYFAGTNGKLQPEKRAVSYETPDDLPRNALQALLDGPESEQLQRAVPSGTQILDLRVTGTLCTLVLSDDFSACDTDAQTAALAVRSVVATLCGLSEIEQVQLQLANGEDLTYCHIGQPLRPEWTWYN